MTSGSISTIQQIRISDQVADHIVKFIADNRLEPGQSLPSEGELTRLLGVSRPSVREATNALAGRGLIGIASGKTPTVLPLSKIPFSNLVRHGLATQQVTARQVLDVRCALEVQAAVLAAECRTQPDIERLSAVVEQMPVAVGHVEAFSKLDAAFHETVAQAAQNPLLSAVVTGMGEIAFESARSGLERASSQDEWVFILSVHQDIAAAIVRGDAHAARQHVIAHFQVASARYEQS